MRLGASGIGLDGALVDLERLLEAALLLGLRAALEPVRGEPRHAGRKRGRVPFRHGARRAPIERVRGMRDRPRRVPGRRSRVATARRARPGPRGCARPAGGSPRASRAGPGASSPEPSPDPEALEAVADRGRCHARLREAPRAGGPWPPGGTRTARGDEPPGPAGSGPGAPNRGCGARARRGCAPTAGSCRAGPAGRARANRAARPRSRCAPSSRAPGARAPRAGSASGGRLRRAAGPRTRPTTSAVPGPGAAASTPPAASIRTRASARVIDASRPVRTSSLPARAGVHSATPAATASSVDRAGARSTGRPPRVRPDPPVGPAGRTPTGRPGCFMRLFPDEAQLRS